MDYIILEPWALAAQSLADPMQRLAFWDAIAAFALQGREPDPSDGIGVGPEIVRALTEYYNHLDAAQNVESAS